MLRMENAAEKTVQDSDRDDTSHPSDGEVGAFSSNTSGEVDSCNLELSEVLSPEQAKKELMGQVVQNEKEAYRLYRDYGRKMGFNVRKGKQYYYIGSRNIRKKYYYCSKEGAKIDKLSSKSKFHRKDVRTGCKAFVQFTVDEKGQWKVTQLGVEHNHDLVKPKERRVLKPISSSKSAEASLPYSTMDVEIHTLNADSGGDTENGDSYVNLQQMAQIKVEETRSLISYFKRKAGEEGMFYWDVQVDHEGRMTNFFWRDGRSRIDYDCFCDVVSFDSTSYIKKYGFTCLTLIGVNHHWQNVMFGCAFLLDETESSFVWLLKTFLESMGNRPPRTILTNDDLALGRAIELVLPSTKHRLCLWHISKKASSCFGSLNSSKRLLHSFDKCLQGCDSEMEFEETWRKMVLDYGVEDHEWLNNLYKNRQKWCSVLSKDCFDGGIESPQRSESFENVLNGIVDRSISLDEFTCEFEKMLEDWRQNEAKEDFACRQDGPRRAIEHSDILKHAAKLYTHKIYKIFEEEFLDGCCAASFREIHCGGDLYRFELTMQGRDSKVWIVHLDISKMELWCTCNKFNTMGILCSHALKALSLKNVNRIPENYIIKRWTKDARKGVYRLEGNWQLLGEDLEDEFKYRKLAIRYAYDLVMRSQGHKQARKIIWDSFLRGERQLDSFFEKKCLVENSGNRDNSDESEGEESAEKSLRTSSLRKSNSRKTKKKRSVDLYRGDELGEPNCSTFPPLCNSTSATQLGFFPSLSPGCFSPPMYTPLSQMPTQISNINWVLGSPPSYASNAQGNQNAAQNLHL
ncbi:hypothetical protein KFK09_027769 [Dendrobium nobile]|uniref:SWIM-type domain-containing protein n=1 Tax=Dendrobium nobile TaxID=94219 RepID=A0A8T3A0V8_DENNO|nr:hypothetical protein KFK09_027769 [Dendrobium nobile]